MDSKYAFADADYKSQTAAMNANLNALEATLLNFTLWNYVAENCHEWGDGWYFLNLFYILGMARIYLFSAWMRKFESMKPC